MNGIELRIWKLNELNKENKMEDEIKAQQKSLELRKALIEKLDILLGDLLGDLIDGPIEPRGDGIYGWKLPMAYRAIPGYFCIDYRKALYCKFADNYDEYISNMDTSGFVEFLANRYANYILRHKNADED